MLTYDDNEKAKKAHCRLAFSAQRQKFFLPLLVGLHGSTDTTARKSAIIEEKMFWKVTFPSTLIFSAKMFARLTLQFLLIIIIIIFIDLYCANIITLTQQNRKILVHIPKVLFTDHS